MEEPAEEWNLSSDLESQQQNGYNITVLEEETPEFEEVEARIRVEPVVELKQQSPTTRVPRINVEEPAKTRSEVVDDETSLKFVDSDPANVSFSSVLLLVFRKVTSELVKVHQAVVEHVVYLQYCYHTHCPTTSSPASPGSKAGSRPDLSDCSFSTAAPTFRPFFTQRVVEEEDEEEPDVSERTPSFCFPHASSSRSYWDGINRRLQARKVSAVVVGIGFRVKVIVLKLF